jgi:hypothetical protein
MAFLSGVHYNLPVGIVNRVQTLKANTNGDMEAEMAKPAESMTLVLLRTVHVLRRKIALDDDAIGSHLQLLQACDQACDQCHSSLPSKFLPVHTVNPVQTRKGAPDVSFSFTRVVVNKSPTQKLGFGLCTLDEREGAFVTKLKADSISRKAGMRENDWIHAICDTVIGNKKHMDVLKLVTVRLPPSPSSLLVIRSVVGKKAAQMCCRSVSFSPFSGV